MALHAVLRVNDEPIGRFYARRREVDIPADRICTYDVTISAPKQEPKRVVVRHNYDHGGWCLVRCALAQAGVEQ